MTSDDDAPSRSDLVWLDLSPQTGHEQEGRRPALVISPLAYNRKVGLALVCPVTSRRKGYPFEVALPEQGDVTGVVLSDQLKSLDWRAQRAERVGTVPDEVMRAVVARVLPLVQG